jgi:7-cyano-7-deazaguanine synthase
MKGAPKAVVLLSGGLDSTTTLAIAKHEGFEPYALTVDYGQRARAEIDAARRVAAQLGAVEHVVATTDLRVFGGSALTSDLPIPRGRSIVAMTSEIPVTYVPARNTIMLSFALAWADVLRAAVIYPGANAADRGGYPDCRPEYMGAFERMANLAIKAAVEGHVTITVRTPLIQCTKADIVRRGLALGVDYSLTVSCYEPTGLGEACGRCDPCLLRRAGFRDAGADDPTRYRSA